MPKFPRINKASGVWKLNELPTYQLSGQWPDTGDRGVVAGSTTGDGLTIDYIEMTTNGNFIDFGDLPYKLYGAAAGGSKYRGIMLGGSVGGPLYSIPYVTFINFPTTGNAGDFGDLSSHKRYTNGICGNDIRSFFAGGHTGDSGSPANYVHASIDMVTNASQGNTADWGDMTQQMHGGAAVSSPTRGIIFGGARGGGNSNSANIDYFDLSSAGNASDFGDLSSSKRYLSGTSSDVRGIQWGTSTPADDVIDYVTIASTGNSADFGNMQSANKIAASFSDGVGGWKAGGATPSADNTVDYITIATTGNSTDAGDLTVARSWAQGLSQAHGGLHDGRHWSTNPPINYWQSSASNRAVLGGGYDSSYATDRIDYITVTSTGNAADFGDLTIKRYGAQSNGNLLRGIFMGGTVPALRNRIDYITIDTTGNAADFGDLDNYGISHGGGGGNNIRGFAAGGQTPTISSPNWINWITYVEMATLGNGMDFGNLTTAGTQMSATSGTTRGIIHNTKGDNSTNAESIEQIQIATTGNATDFGDLTVSRAGGAGSCASNTRAVFGGGHDGSVSNVMDYVTIASAGNATDFGNLVTARNNVSENAAATTRGIFAGGTAPSLTNEIDYITIATTGNATDFGNLNGTFGYMGAACDAHGGL